jgi:two-component system response regulator AtoC
LRERKDDIPLLVDYFVDTYCHELKSGKKTVSPEALELMVNYPWKGNVRELENCIERAVILCDGDTITRGDIVLNSQMMLESSLSHLPMDGPLEDSVRAAVKIAETQRIRKALKETKGNKSRASELLQVSYKTLLTKIKDYRLES